MASNTKMPPLKEEALEKEGSEIGPDSPLLDRSDAAIKKLIRSAKKRGYVTHVQINELLSSEEVKIVGTAWCAAMATKCSRHGR